MITTSKMSKKLAAIRRIMDYPQERVKGLWGEQKYNGGLGHKLVSPPVFRNIPPGADSVDYIQGLGVLTRARCNLLLTLVASLPEGVVWSPAQYGLFNTLFFHHLSKTSFVKPPKQRGDQRSESERLLRVDIERTLPHYFIRHGNTNHQHEHGGVGMVHPYYARVVEINGGRFKIAVLFAACEALKDMGYDRVNPYALGTHDGWPIVALATHLRKDGSLKSGKQLKAEGLIKEVCGAVKDSVAEILAHVGIGNAPDTELDPIKTTKAEAIRGKINVAREIRALFPDGPACLGSNYVEENRLWLKHYLAKRNAGLKVGRYGGLVFSMDGLHEAAEIVDPRWKRELVEKRCGLDGNWALGKSAQEQSNHLRKQQQQMFRSACARLRQVPDQLVMCRFLDAFPREWRQVTVDVLTFENNWAHIGTLHVSLGVGLNRTPALLDLVNITHSGKFPLGAVFITPIFPASQLPLFLYNIPGSETKRLRAEMAPALLVQTGDDEYAAMILVEALPEGTWQTHNARSRLGHELSRECKCDFGIYGLPLPGLPLFPNPFLAKQVGQTSIHTSLPAQRRLAAVWQALQVEEVASWQKVPPSTATWLAAEIGRDLAQAGVPLPQIFPAAIADAKKLWRQPDPMAPLLYVAPAAKRAHIPIGETARQASQNAGPLRVSPPAATAKPQPPKHVLSSTPAMSRTGLASIPAEQTWTAPASPARKPQTNAPHATAKTTTDPVPTSPTSPPTASAQQTAGEEEKKKKLRARRMALLAGHYHINGTLQQIEDTVEKADLDPLTPAIYGCVWCGVMAEKEDPRFKELVAFMARRSDVEPPWLAQAVDQASQDLMTSLAKEQELAR